MAENAPQGKSGLAIAGLVLGIVGIVGSWIPILNNFSFILAALGLIFGVIGLVVVLRSSGQKGGKGMAIAAVVVSLLACVIVFATQNLYSQAIDEASDQVQDTIDKADGSATDELLETDVTVEFGAFSAEDQGYGLWKTAIPVTVTNKASETKNYMIQVEAVDASGTRIDSAYVTINSLASGQSATEDAFTYVSSDNIEAMQQATFKVASVMQS